MKKIIIAAALIFITGVVTLYTRQGNVQATSNTIKINFFSYNKELASGD